MPSKEEEDAETRKKQARAKRLANRSRGPRHGSVGASPLLMVTWSRSGNGLIHFRLISITSTLGAGCPSIVRSTDWNVNVWSFT
jgi:hypothetical protein